MVRLTAFKTAEGRPSSPKADSIPANTRSRWWAGSAACRPANEGLGYFEGLRDAGQFPVEHASEGEQIVALVPQRDAHWVNAPRILWLETLQFIGDEVEQLSPRRQLRSGQRQNVVAQPS
jgi:hypothetical protein